MERYIELKSKYKDLIDKPKQFYEEARTIFSADDCDLIFFCSILVPSSRPAAARPGCLALKLMKWNQNFASGTQMEPKWKINTRITQGTS